MGQLCYIRFLKTPSFVPSGAKTGKIQALITVVNDLGEHFCEKDLKLLATLHGPNRKWITAGHANVNWTPGMRQAWISIDYQDARLLGTVALSIEAESGPYILQPDCLDPKADICVFSIMSDQINSVELPKAENSVVRFFRLGEDNELRITEDVANSIARHTWDAGLALVHCLIAIKESPEPKQLTTLRRVLLNEQNKTPKIVELGSGCGVVGIALAQLYRCNVTLTDLPDAMDTLQTNIAQAKRAQGSSMRARVLDWFQETPTADWYDDLDLIVMADCTYNPDTAPALVNTVVTLSQRSPQAPVVVSMKHRHTSEAIFFELMRKARFQQVDCYRSDFSVDESHHDEDRLGEIDIYVYKLAP